MNAPTIACAFLAGLWVVAGASAQNYPSKPVRVVIPISAGSGLDIVGRSVSQKLSELWSQPVVVDNRPGAGGSVGTALVGRSSPDGHTLLISGSSHAVNPAIYAKLPYDTLTDFVAISPLASLTQTLLVAPSAGFKSMAELLAAAKAKPGQLTFASPGTGTGNHFAAEKLKLMAGINVVHVPFKGGPEALTDVVAGRVTFLFNSIGASLPLVQAGKLRPLAVTSRQRSGAFPEVPTIMEAGVAGFESSLWFGIWAPARTPADVVEKIARYTERALAAPDVREKFQSLIAEPMHMPPAEFARFVRSETEVAARVAKAAGIQPQ